MSLAFHILVGLGGLLALSVLLFAAFVFMQWLGETMWAEMIVGITFIVAACGRFGYEVTSHAPPVLLSIVSVVSGVLWFGAVLTESWRDEL